MSSGFKWERAAKRDKLKRYPKTEARDELRKRRAHKRQQTIQTFVRKHTLTCFVCGEGGPIEWAKSGVSKRGPWALCARCAANKRQAARPAAPTPEA